MTSKRVKNKDLREKLKGRTTMVDKYAELRDMSMDNILSILKSIMSFMTTVSKYKGYNDALKNSPYYFKSKDGTTKTRDRASSSKVINIFKYTGPNSAGIKFSKINGGRKLLDTSDREYSNSIELLATIIPNTSALQKIGAIFNDYSNLISRKHTIKAGGEIKLGRTIKSSYNVNVHNNFIKLYAKLVNSIEYDNITSNHALKFIESGKFIAVDDDDVNRQIFYPFPVVPIGKLSYIQHIANSRSHSVDMLSKLFPFVFKTIHIDEDDPTIYKSMYDRNRVRRFILNLINPESSGAKTISSYIKALFTEDKTMTLNGSDVYGDVDKYLDDKLRFKDIDPKGISSFDSVELVAYRDESSYKPEDAMADSRYRTGCLLSHRVVNSKRDIGEKYVKYNAKFIKPTKFNMNENNDISDIQMPKNQSITPIQADSRHHVASFTRLRELNKYLIKHENVSSTNRKSKYTVVVRVKDSMNMSDWENFDPESKSAYTFHVYEKGYATIKLMDKTAPEGSYLYHFSLKNIFSLLINSKYTDIINPGDKIVYRTANFAGRLSDNIRGVKLSKLLIDESDEEFENMVQELRENSILLQEDLKVAENILEFVQNNNNSMLITLSGKNIFTAATSFYKENNRANSRSKQHSELSSMFKNRRRSN